MAYAVPESFGSRNMRTQTTETPTSQVGKEDSTKQFDWTPKEIAIPRRNEEDADDDTLAGLSTMPNI